MLTEDDFLQLLELREIGGVEFKASQPLREALKVLRAILGFSNRRGGGHILLGVGESTDGPALDGMKLEDLATWTEDNLNDQLANTGEPRPEIRLEQVVIDTKVFVVIRVFEFHEQPVLCKRDAGDSVLRRGALYVRPRGLAKTVEVSTMEDMRSLLDLATEKRLQDFFRATKAAGIVVAHENDDLEGPNPFDQELAGFGDA